MENIKQRIGVGAWLELENSRTAMFLPLLSEDMGKFEVVKGYGIELDLSMLGLISGGVKNGEAVDSALVRETMKERQVRFQSGTDLLPNTIKVEQHRNGDRVDFEVVLFRVIVNSGQLSEISERVKPVLVGEGALDKYVEDVGMEIFRPFAFVFIELMLKNNFYRN